MDQIKATSDSKISLLITEQLWNHVASGTIDLETLQQNLEKIVEQAHAAGVIEGLLQAAEICDRQEEAKRQGLSYDNPGSLALRIRQKAEEL